eukprot:4632527-Alexandrium_andersonii.AAC.1
MSDSRGGGEGPRRAWHCDGGRRRLVLHCRLLVEILRPRRGLVLAKRAPRGRRLQGAAAKGSRGGGNRVERVPIAAALRAQ